MDRVMVYPGAIPQETDILSTNKDAMIGIAKLAHAVLGDGPWLQGLACTPNSPAALNVLVAPGQIYSLQNIDGTAYSSLAADTTHTILKQGISLDTVTLATPAPTTAGYSVNYLVQIAYLDTDSGATVLPYYNASNPAVAYSGPANSGTAQNTVRKGVCSITVKTGVAATTGSQTTPAPDAGYIGAYVVTVANGATTVTAPNIVLYTGAPFIPTTLTKAAGLQLANIFTLAGNQFTNPLLVAPATLPGQAVNLGQFVNSFASSGYAKLPGGLILQWGQASVAANNANTDVLLPIAYPTAHLSAAANVVGVAAATLVGAAPLSVTTIRLNQSYTGGAQQCWWFSIGN